MRLACIKTIGYGFAITLTILSMTSCKNATKKVAKDVVESTVGKSGRVVKEAGEKNLREIGEKGVRELPVEIVLKAMEKDNPVLAKGLKKVSKPFKRALAERVQTDPRVYSVLVNKPNILDEFFEFTGKKTRAAKDPNLFVWYARAQSSADDIGAENYLKRFLLSDDGEHIIILTKNDGNRIADISDGIVILEDAFHNPARLLSEESVLKHELIPNSLYKIRDVPSGAEYRYMVDDMGRVSSVRVKNVTQQELAANVFELRPELSLGASGEDILAKFGPGSGTNDIDLNILYSYIDESVSPSYIRIEGEVSGEHIVAETIPLKSTERRFANNLSSSGYESISEDFMVLRNTSSTSYDKYHALRNIDTKYRELPELEQQRFDALPEDIRAMLDRYQALRYSETGYSHTPQSHGIWDGENGNSLFKPDRDFHPANKQYNNLEDKSWGQILDENRIEGIRYIKGEPDFEPIAVFKTTIDFDSELSAESRAMLLSPKKDRAGLHEEFYAKLAKENNCTVAEIKAIKESQNLVVHECPDCKTLLLIPREVHDNMPHTGGVEMFRMINGL